MTEIKLNITSGSWMKCNLPVTICSSLSTFQTCLFYLPLTVGKTEPLPCQKVAHPLTSEVPPFHQGTPCQWKGGQEVLYIPCINGTFLVMIKGKMAFLCLFQRHSLYPVCYLMSCDPSKLSLYVIGKKKKSSLDILFRLAFPLRINL